MATRGQYSEMAPDILNAWPKEKRLVYVYEIITRI